MVEPTLTELSGVDHPAHLTEGWLMMKGASPEIAQMLANAELIAKGIDPASVTSPVPNATLRSGSMADGLDDTIRAALPDEVQTYIKSLEDDAAAVTTSTAITKSAEDLDAEEFEKSLAGLPEGVRKSISTMQRETAAAKAMAKSLHDAAEDTRFEDMAKQLTNLPGVDDKGGEFASVMRKAAESNPAAFDGIFKVLKAADSAIEQSNAWGAEIGSSAIGEGSAAASLEGYAKSYQAEDKDLSYPEAMVKAAELHPELYNQHRKEA